MLQLPCISGMELITLYNMPYQLEQGNYCSSSFWNEQLHCNYRYYIIYNILALHGVSTVTGDTGSSTSGMNSYITMNTQYITNILLFGGGTGGATANGSTSGIDGYITINTQYIASILSFGGSFSTQVKCIISHMT